jgi:hypothetical protein
MVQEKLDAGDSYVYHVAIWEKKELKKEVIFTQACLIIINYKSGQEFKTTWRDIAFCEMQVGQ